MSDVGKKNKSDNSGIAVIEFTAIMVILFSFTLGGFGIVEYLNTLRQINVALDKYIYDSAVKPFTLRTQSGQIEFETDHAGLRDLIDSVNTQLFRDLSSNMEFRDEQSAGHFMIETAYAELNIDETSGAAQGLRIAPLTYSRKEGAFQPSSLVEGQTSLETAFQSALQSNNQEFNSYAVPAGVFFNDQAENRFLPTSILIGGRVAVSLNGTLAGSLLSFLRGTDVVYSSKILSLRGEFKNEI